MSKVRVRIAPAPTGSLHLGTAHTALFNYLFAKNSGGDFILRIDDSDEKRSKKEYEKDIMDSLKWLGISWDEGPDIGGPCGFYRQSQRSKNYKKYIEKLLKDKKAYFCFCTPQELEQERKELEKQKKRPIYSGKCRDLSDEQIEKLKKEGKKGAIRIINPQKIIKFEDLIRGQVSVDSSLFGDFVIARSDMSALLNLAATVDDIEFKITHAIRGEDFLNMVPRQLLIYEALGEKPPQFGHLSFLYAPDKTKLSKRHGATSVEEYRKMGYLKKAMINYLGILGYSMSDDREIFSFHQLIKNFDIKKVQKGAPIFSIKKLNWFNAYYLRKHDDSKLASLIDEFYSGKYQKGKIEKTIPLVKERIQTLADYSSIADFFFNKPKKYEMDFSDKKELFEVVIEELEKLEDWQADKIGEMMLSLCQKKNMKTGKFFMILRVAITGKKITPPLNESMEILGKEEVLARLRVLH